MVCMCGCVWGWGGEDTRAVRVTRTRRTVAYLASCAALEVLACFPTRSTCREWHTSRDPPQLTHEKGKKRRDEAREREGGERRRANSWVSGGQERSAWIAMLKGVYTVSLRVCVYIQWRKVHTQSSERRLSPFSSSLLPSFPSFLSPPHTHTHIALNSLSFLP